MCRILRKIGRTEIELRKTRGRINSGLCVGLSPKARGHYGALGVAIFLVSRGGNMGVSSVLVSSGCLVLRGANLGVSPALVSMEKSGGCGEISLTDGSVPDDC